MWKSKWLKTVLALALVVVLCLAVALPAMAESSTTPTPTASDANLNWVKGKVASIAADQKSFGVLITSGETVLVSVDANTKYYSANGTAIDMGQIKDKVQTWMKDKNQTRTDTAGAQSEQNDTDYEQDADMEAVLTANTEAQQGVWGKLKSWFNRHPKIGEKAAFTDLAVGDAVVVKVMPNENLAKQVLIIKASDVKTVKGNITAVTSTSLTITPIDTSKEVVTLKWDENSRINVKGAISLKTGQYAVAVYKVSNLTVIMMEVLPSAPGVTPTATVTPTAVN